MNTHKLQSTLLDMYVDVSSKCENNGINIFLGGRTLLGAIRHGGFIPWDDDMDLMILRKDVEKFISIMSELEKYTLKNSENTNDFEHSF